MIDIMDKVQKVTNLGKSPREKQKLINVNEVFYIWDILVTKLDILETIEMFENFIDDYDLKLINAKVRNIIVAGIKDMEDLMAEYALPFPERPPADIRITTNLEQVTEKYIYRSLYESIQAFFFILASGFMNSNNPHVMKVIKEHLHLTLELQEILVEYGKIKGMLNLPPLYRA